MATYKVRAPDGKVITLRGPDGASQEEIIAQAQRLYVPEEEEPKEQAGFFRSMYEEATKPLRLAPELAAYATKKDKESAEALAKAAESEYDTSEFVAPTSLENIGQDVTALKQQLGSSIGAMAAPVAAAAITKNPMAGYSAFTAEHSIDNLIRQAQEQKTGADVDVGKAIFGGAAQAGLDMTEFALLGKMVSKVPGLRNLVTTGTAEEESAKIIKAFKENKLTFKNGMARGILETGAVEVPTEVAQQVLERWQAGLPLGDDQATSEYKQAAIGAAALSGVFGPIGGAIQTSAQRSQAQAAIAAEQPQAQQAPDQTGQPPAPPPPATPDQTGQPPVTPDQTGQPPAPPAPPAPPPPVSEIVDDDALRDAGFSDAKIEQLKQDPVKLAEVSAYINTGHAYTLPAQNGYGQRGNFRLITPDDITALQDALPEEQARPEVIRLQRVMDRAKQYKIGKSAQVVAQQAQQVADQQAAAAAATAPPTDTTTAPPTDTTALEEVVPESTTEESPYEDMTELDEDVGAQAAAEQDKTEQAKQTAMQIVGEGGNKVAVTSALKELGLKVNEVNALYKSLIDQGILIKKANKYVLNPENEDVATRISTGEADSETIGGGDEVSGERSLPGGPSAEDARAKGMVHIGQVIEDALQGTKPSQTSLDDFRKIAEMTPADYAKRRMMYEASQSESERLAREEAEGERYRQGEAPRVAAVPKETAQNIVNEVTSGWTNAPKINVVETAEELPAEHRKKVDSSTKGFYDPKTGTVHVISSNATDDADVKATIFHEALGHYGLDQLFGKKLTEVLTDMYRTNKALRDMADAWLKRNPDSYKNSPNRNARAVEEVLAELSEKGPIKHPAIRAAFNRVAALIRKFIRAMGIPLEYSNADISQIISSLHEAHTKVIEGKPRVETTAETETRYAKTEYPTKDSKGRPIHPVAEGIKNFWKWFGDSKIVDRYGRPIAYYHGTDADIKAFRRGTTYSKAIFISPKPEVAGQFVPVIGSGNMYKLYVKAVKPFDFENEEHVKDVINSLSDNDIRIIAPVHTVTGTPYSGNDLGQMMRNIKDKVMSGDWRAIENTTFQKGIRQQGYDAFFVKEHNVKNLAVYDPNQLKSAVGNEGLFSEENDDIRYRQLATPSTNFNQSDSRYQKFLSSLLEKHGELPLVPEAVNALSNVPSGLRRAWFATLTMFNLERLYGKYAPKIAQVAKSFAKMSKDKHDMLEKFYRNNGEYSKILRTKPDAIRDKFDDFIGILGQTQALVFERKTANGIDSYEESKIAKKLVEDVASGKRKYETLTAEGQELHNVTKLYMSLPADVQGVVKNMLADYRNVSNIGFRATVNKIKALVGDKTLAKVINELESKRLEYYTPFVREGLFKLTYTRPNGERGAQQFKSEAARLVAERQLAAEGNKDFQRSVLTDRTEETRLPPTGLLSTVLDEVRASQTLSESQLAKLSEEERAEYEERLESTVNAIWDGFLEYMPNKVKAEAMGRKKIVREDGTVLHGVHGFRTDALKVYQEYMPKIVYQINNLNWVGQLEEAYDGVKADLAAYANRAPNDPRYAGMPELSEKDTKDLLASIRKRIDFAKKPTYNGLVNATSKMNYYMSIAGNISSAIINTTVLPMMVLPMLGGKYGYAKSAKYMTHATKLYPAFRELDMAGNTPEAQAKFKQRIAQILKETGTSVTPEQMNNFYTDLLGLSATGAASLQELRHSQGVTGTEKTLESINKVAGFAFREAEQFNRGVTHLASFLLKMDDLKGKGKDSTSNYEAAVREAYLFNGEMNGSGNAESGSEFYQTNWGRVLGTFRTFSLNMMINTALAFKNALKATGATGEERKLIKSIAWKQIGGIYAMAFLFAGVRGLPLYGAAEILASLFMDDEDEPFDFDQWVLDAVGPLAYGGPVSAWLQGDIGNRTGFNGLLWRDDPKRLSEVGLMTYAAEKLGGATVGVGLNLQRGLGLFREGQIMRGLEAITPSALRNILRTTRYVYEGGVKTKAGESLMDDPNTYNLAMQLIGISPTELVRNQMQNSAKYNIRQSLISRRSALLNKLFAARQAGDADLVAETMEEIIKFRQANPTMWGNDTIERSYRSKIARAKDTVNGLYMSQKDAAAVQQYMADTYDEDEDESYDEDEEEED